LLGYVCLLAVALSGCSIATQNAATPLPAQLRLPPTSSTTTTTLPVSKGTHELQVYFLKNGQLYPVQQPYSTDPIVTALTALAIGPSPDERANGITSAFSESPAQITSAGTRNNGKTALVQIDQAFLDLQGEAFEEAAAQAVYTVTGLTSGPKSVEFLLGSVAKPVLVPPGFLVSGPVTRENYCASASGTPWSFCPTP
jgi:spore germination protein GerM